MWYRAAFFIPVVTSGVATAIMWQIVLSKFGIANYLLGLVAFDLLTGGDMSALSARSS